MKVLPVPVASVSRMRSLSAAIGLQHAFDGDVLVVAALEVATLVLKRHGGEAIAPGVGFGEGPVPEFVGRGIRRRSRLPCRLHVDGVDALAVGGVGEANRELCGVLLGLRDAFGERFVPGLGFDDGELGVAVFEDVVGE